MKRQRLKAWQRIVMRGVSACELAEGGDGEERILVRVERSVSVRRGDARTGRRKPVVRARCRYDSPSDVAVRGVVWPRQWPVFRELSRSRSM